MLIDRYVFREIAGPSILGLLVWTSIFVVNQFFRLADQWVSRVLTAEDLGLALLYYLPSIVAITIPMSILLGILIGFSRLSTDTEITAMRTTGISYYRLLLPTAVLAILGFSATAVIYIRAVPKANSEVVEILQRAARRTDLNREIRPGVWTPLAENSPGQDVAIFARGVDTSSGEPWLTDVDLLSIDRVQDVAEHDFAKRARMTRVLTSESSARIKFVFEDLRSIRWKPNDPTEQPTLVDAREGERLGPERKVPGGRNFATQRGIEKGTRMQTIDELRETLRALDTMDEADRLELSDPKAAAKLRAATRVPVVKSVRDRLRRAAHMELHKKYAIPVACLVFAMAGMPLGIATRRGGRPASFIISVGVILLWWAVYSSGEAWVMAGKLSPPLGAWLPDIVLGVVGLNLLFGQRRQQGLGLYRALRDLQLLGATTFLVLGGLLLYERFALSSAEPLPAYPYWVPLLGLVLLVGHVLFVAFRDAIARRLAALTEAFRRPRRGATNARAAARMLSFADEEAPEPSRGAPAPGPDTADLERRRARFGRLRGMVVFAQLSLLAFSIFVAATNEDGIAAGLVEVVTGWEGVAFILLVGCGIALQRVGFGIFSTLDWFVLGTYARVLGLVMASLFVLYVVQQYLELASAILQHQPALANVMRYFYYFSPRILFETAPIAAMVAAIVTFGVMTRYNEMTALRCGGVSAYRVVAPVVLVAVLISSASFVLHDYVLPRSNERADDIKRELQGAQPVRRGATRGFLTAEDGGALYQFRSVAVRDAPDGTRPAQITGLTVLRQDGTGRVQEMFSAKEAVWMGDAWQLRGGWRAVISEDRKVKMTTFTETPSTTLEPPEFFTSMRRDPDQMSFAEYARFVEDQAAAGHPTSKLEVTLQRKLAYPAAALVMVLVGIPFAFATGRKGALYGLGISVILYVIYYAASALFTALGSAGYLPPVAAAWAPNILFAVVGLYAMLHVRT